MEPRKTADDGAANPGKKLPDKSRECANCTSTEGTLMACSRCELVSYCSKDCQTQHWKAEAGHRKQCVPKKTRVPQPAENTIGTKSAAQSSSDDVCSICLDAVQMSSPDACTLDCFHCFHKDCVAGIRSYGLSQVCPICRAPLTGTMKEFDYFTRKLFSLKKRLRKQGSLSDTEYEDMVTCEYGRLMSQASYQQKKSDAVLIAGCGVSERLRLQIRDCDPKLPESGRFVKMFEAHKHMLVDATTGVIKSEACFLALVVVSENQRNRLRENDMEMKRVGSQTAAGNLRHWITRQKRKFSDFPCPAKYL